MSDQFKDTSTKRRGEKRAGDIAGSLIAGLPNPSPISFPQECIWCGKEVRTPGRPVLDPVCRGCAVEKAQEKEAAKARRKTVSWFDRNCPEAFKTYDPNLLPDLHGFEKIQTWEFGDKGLLVVGVTGSGKTRSAWTLIRNLSKRGISVIVMDSIRFGSECHRASLTGDFDWADRLSEVDLLVLDDLGKGKFTERVQADLFGIIDRRTSNLRPMVITTQLNPKELGAMLSPDRRDALLRRMRENFEVRVLRSREQVEKSKSKGM